MTTNPLQGYQVKIIALLTQQQLLIGELYMLFSRVLPEHGEFWKRLADEEMELATWIDYLLQKINEGGVLFSEKKIKTYTVESFTQYLKDAIEKVHAEKPSMVQALRLASDIENALLVKNLFEHFAGVRPDIELQLKTLKAKVRDHGRQIAKMQTDLNASGRS